MSNDVQKLKQAITILKKENSDFKRYNGHLQSAIFQVSESNEKLLYSLHEKYNYFGDLESKNKFIEVDIKKKLYNIENFDFNVNKLNQPFNLDKSINSNTYNNQLNHADKYNLDQKNSKIHQITSNQENSKVANNIKNPKCPDTSQKELNYNSLNQTNSSIYNYANQDNKLNSVNSNSKNQEGVKNPTIDDNISDVYNHEDQNSKKEGNSAKNSDFKHSSRPNTESNSSKTIESNTRYSQKSIKSLAMQSFSNSGLDSIEKLKQKQSFLYETNQKLKTEIEALLSKIGETDLFLKFQKESDSYLRALRELHDVENNMTQTLKPETESEPNQIKESNKLEDNLNQTSSVFLTDIDAKPKIEQNSDHEKENSQKEQELIKDDNCTIIIQKVERGCQTNDNIRIRSIMKHFSKEAYQQYLEKQAQKIAFRRSLIEELTSEIEKCNIALKEILSKKSEVTTILSQIKNISVVDIYNQYNYEDKETETEEIPDIDSIISQIEENKQFTKEYLIYSNKKFNLQTIYDQKSIELKLAQSSTDHKTACYRSLLRNLKTTDPDSYAKFIGTVGICSKDEQKRQRCLYQINKFTEKIKNANEETKNIEIKEKQVRLRIEMLERELAVFNNPKDHMKSVLTDLCQRIALNQEKIRDQLRGIAFAKLESDFVDRIKTRIFKETSKIDILNQKINEMDIKLKKIKGRCRYSLRSGQNYPITSPSELDFLQETFDKIEKEVNSFDEKIDIYANKSVSYYQQLTSYKLNVPSHPKSCHTVQMNLKNVM